VGDHNEFVKAIFELVDPLIPPDPGQRSRWYSYPNFPVNPLGGAGLSIPIGYIGPPSSDTDIGTKTENIRRLTFPITIYMVYGGDTGPIDKIAMDVRDAFVQRGPDGVRLRAQDILDVDGWTVYAIDADGPTDAQTDEEIYARRIVVTLEAVETGAAWASHIYPVLAQVNAAQVAGATIAIDGELIDRAAPAGLGNANGLTLIFSGSGHLAATKTGALNVKLYHSASPIFLSPVLFAEEDFALGTGVGVGGTTIKFAQAWDVVLTGAARYLRFQITPTLTLDTIEWSAVAVVRQVRG
jgi:hypothetical protein